MPDRNGIPKRSVIVTLMIATAGLATRLLGRRWKPRAIQLGTVSERWLASERNVRQDKSNDVSR